eukprot:6188211-Pleurochrysis_carterae.AAC.1
MVESNTTHLDLRAAGGVHLLARGVFCSQPMRCCWSNCSHTQAGRSVRDTISVVFAALLKEANWGNAFAKVVSLWRTGCANTLCDHSHGGFEPGILRGCARMSILGASHYMAPAQRIESFCHASAGAANPDKLK